MMTPEERVWGQGSIVTVPSGGARYTALVWRTESGDYPQTRLGAVRPVKARSAGAARARLYAIAAGRAAQMDKAQARIEARAAGKAKTAELIVWQLTVGAVAFRCLQRTENSYEVQARSRGWRKLVVGNDAHALLQRIASSGPMLGLCRRFAPNHDV